MPSALLASNTTHTEQHACSKAYKLYSALQKQGRDLVASLCLTVQITGRSTEITVKLKLSVEFLMSCLRLESPKRFSFLSFYFTARVALRLFRCARGEKDIDGAVMRQDDMRQVLVCGASGPEAGDAVTGIQSFSWAVSHYAVCYITPRRLPDWTICFVFVLWVPDPLSVPIMDVI